MASIAGERYVAWGDQVNKCATAVAGTKWEPTVEVDISDNQNILTPSSYGLMFDEKFRMGRFQADGRISGILEPENMWIYLGAWGLLGTPAITGPTDTTSYLHNWDEGDFSLTPEYSTVEIEEDIKQRRYTGWVPNSLKFNMPSDDLLTYEIGGSAVWVDYQTLDTSEAYSTLQPFSGLMGEHTLFTDDADGLARGKELTNASVTFASPDGGFIEESTGSRQYGRYRHGGLEITGNLEIPEITADTDDVVEEFWNGASATEPADDTAGGTAYDPFYLDLLFTAAENSGAGGEPYEFQIELPTCVPDGPLSKRVTGTDTIMINFPFRAIREDGANLYDLKLVNKVANHFA